MSSLIMEPLQDSKISSNNADESMEVDDFSRMSASSIEDGEISESEVVVTKNKIYENRDGGFTTGVDIFSQETQGKLTERAKRFGLDPKNVCAMSDDQLQLLYESLGLNEQEMRNIRLDTIHIRGTENMSTEDVFEYFKAYGPANIEWISDYSCNVVWNEDSSTARALNGLSKSIKGLKSNKNSDGTGDEESADVETTVIVSKLEDDDGDVVMVEEEFEHVANAENTDTVQASSIKIPIPPGYWRYGLPHPKAKCILLRFATKTDRKPMYAEKMSTYYKKYGNPNFGGMRGLISDSRRKSKIGFLSTRESETYEVDKKNPWGKLSKQWDNEPQEVVEPVDVVTKPSSANRPILERIGIRRDTKKRSVKSSGGESDSSEEWKKRIKKPRMKMYADEEQQKINKNRLHKVSQTKYTSTNSQVREQEFSDYEDHERIPPRKAVAKSNIKSRLGKIVKKEEPKRTPAKSNIKERLSQRRYSYDSDNYVNDIHSAQPYASVVQKVRRPSPIRSAITSTITRYEVERRRNNTSESSYVSSDNETGEKRDLRQSVRTKSVVHRPGFDEDLRSRLSHNSIATGSKALRIEVNNEYYSDNS